jgi:hypothetical protein
VFFPFSLHLPLLPGFSSLFPVLLLLP